MGLNQLLFHFQREQAPPDKEAASEWIDVGPRRLQVHFRRNARARHYLLYMRSDQSVSLTIPRRGNRREGLDFCRSRTQWIERQLRKLEASVIPQKTWKPGTEILFRGEPVCLQLNTVTGTPFLEMGEERLQIKGDEENYRPLVQEWLHQIARRELPGRVAELAAHHGLQVKKITVRNQSSRWGSCSTSGQISLNWRLIQTPSDVRDYVILHELMHLREMNHSPRFWTLVENACPTYRDAEKWLKVNGAKLGL